MIKKLCLMMIAAVMFCSEVFANATEERIELEKGSNKLIGVLTKPENMTEEKAPLAIIMHGVTANKDEPLYKNISDALVQNGIPTLRFDFNGHGESGGRDVDMTVQKELEDAKAYFNYAKGLDWVSEIIFIGHSQGGLVAGLVAGELGKDNVPYLIQVAPAAAAVDLPKTGQFGGVQVFDPNNLPEKVPFPNNFFIGREYLETVGNLPVYETAAKYQGKVLLIQGSADDIVAPSYAIKYNKAYPNCTYKLIDGENHMFTEKQDETIKYIVDFVLENK